MLTIEEIKVLELFGGIGAIRKAFIRQKIPHRIIDYVEVDKNCVKSYNALYGGDFLPQDIVKYSPPAQKIDFVMHGSPCQDFSLVGLKKGGKKGSGTRSSLLFETIRIIEEMKEKPKIVLWENVKGVLCKNMRVSFFNYLKEMERLGYENKYKILNAMDFGIPQNRNRIFVVSILGQNDFNFEALKKVETKSIDNFLDKRVSDLYQVKQKSMLRNLSSNFENKNLNFHLKIIDKYAYTITTKQLRIPNSGVIAIENDKYRYLTERECFRLMGFSDSDVDKLEEVHQRKKNCTSYKLYKQAGNSIVVDILMAILQEIYKEKE